jgi:hypothetical protein
MTRRKLSGGNGFFGGRKTWPDRHQHRRKTVKHSKLQLLTTALVLSVFGFLGQTARPMSADGAMVPLLVSYSPMDAMSSPSGAVAETHSPIDATSSPSGAMAGTKKLRMACYPAGGECEHNSDCCTGFCRAGRVAAYCDN